MELAVGTSEPTIKSLLSKLGGLLAAEYSLIRGVRGDIQFINDELGSMQAFLSNLTRCGTDGHDEQTEDWMKQVRDVSYDIEDCVDDFTHGLRPDPQSNDWLSKVRGFLYELRTWKTRRDIAAQIADLKERAQRVGERRERYGVRDPEIGKKKVSMGGATGYLAAEHQGATRRLIGIKEPVRGEEDMEVLKKWVSLDESKKQQLGVMSIVGFGGVGKTTIARALYRNSGDQFQRRAMVTVSQNSDPEAILWNILSQVKPQANSEEQQGQYGAGTISEDRSFIRSILSRIISPARNQKEDQEKHNGIELQNYLKTYRYLLLIDDVWSSSTWENIKRYFPENGKGSRIIVTTRFPVVATTCCAHKENDRVHPVNVLSDDEARKLFQKSLSECKRTSASQQNQSNTVPDRVWEMCGGLPLAIVTMAGLVASNPLRVHKEWTEVCDSLFPEPEKCRKPEDFMRIINFCYNDLPGDLKTCSLYLSIFPKGRKISRKRLIRRWIAEGLVSEKQGLSVEDVAETCFNQLIERKIVRSIEHSSNGRVKSCQVHDMVLEYIMSKAGEEDFVTVVGGYWSMATRSNKVRRLSLHNSSDSKHASKADRMNLSHVRSLTVFGSLDQLRFKSFKTGIVQVLDLEGCRGFKKNHVSVSDICAMTLLKYLSLRRTDISKLPSNIGNLKCLETLDIRQTEIEELPKSVGQLEQISNILGGDKRTRKTLKLPNDFKGTMKGLRILSGIEIVQGSTAASDLSYFTRLRKLAIYKLHNGDQNQMFKHLLSSIQYLSGYSLQTLVIDDESSDFLNTLDSMTSHPVDLRTLELSGKLLKIPEWLPSLNELTKLTLSATALRKDHLVLLSKLGSLFSLTFSISATNKDPDMAAILQKNKFDSGGEIFFPAGGFGKLKLLRIFVPLLPSLNFSKKATPQLERLELRFKKLEGVHGMDKLGSLHDVLVTVDDKAGEPTKSILEDLKRSSSRKYVLIVSEYHD